MERADPSGGRQRAEQIEPAPERDVVAVMDAAREHQVAASPDQFPHGVVDRDQRRGTRGVDRVRRSAEVESVRGTRGHQVGHHQVDAGLLAQRPEPIDELGAHRLGLILRQIGQQLAQRRHQLVAGPDAVDEGGHAGVEVAAAPEHDADPTPVAEPIRAAGVVDRRRRDRQGDQLLGLDVADRHRHDPEAQRVEGRRCDESAAAGVEPVAGTGLRPVRVEVHRVPAVRGCVGDRVEAVADVGRERAQVDRSGEDRGHPHNRDVDRATHDVAVTPWRRQPRRPTARRTRRRPGARCRRRAR